MHINLGKHALSTRHISLEFGTNMTNLTVRNLKLSMDMLVDITGVSFTEPCHFKLQSPATYCPGSEFNNSGKVWGTEHR